MDLKLNFMGIHAADFGDSFRFYTEVLGIVVRGSKPGWASLETGGMTFELFSGGLPPRPDPSWGNGQPIRPGLQVADLIEATKWLRQRGVEFVGDVETRPWGMIVEFVASEGIRWSLANAPDLPFGDDISRPHLGWAEIKAVDLAGQKALYGDVLGLHLSSESKSHVGFRQNEGEPLLFLAASEEMGGPTGDRRRIEYESCPIFLSFQTKDIEQAADWLSSHSVTVVEDVTRRDWGGLVMVIEDADGNPIQIVQYTSTVPGGPA